MTASARSDPSAVAVIPAVPVTGRAGIAVAPVDPPWLREVRLRVRRRVLFLRHLWRTSPYAGEEQLAISHSEVDRALAAPDLLASQERRFAATDEAAAAIGADIAALADEPQDPRWTHLVHTLGVGPFEEAFLATACAVAADPRLARVLGYLRDSTRPSGATAALTMDLFEGQVGDPVGPGSAVARWQLARPDGAGPDGAGPTSSMCDAELVADPAIVDTLLGHADSDPWSAGTTGVFVAPPVGPGLHAELTSAIAGFVRSLAGRPATSLRVELVGPAGSGRTTAAASAAAMLGVPLVAVDCASVAASADPEAQLIREVRRAVLCGAVVALRHHEALPPALERITDRCGLVFSCVGRQRGPGLDGGPGGTQTICRSYRVPPLSRSQRLTLWSELSDLPVPAPVSDWALRPAEVVVAARVMPAGAESVAEVCRRMLATDVGDLLTSLPLTATWDDLILQPSTAQHLRELEAQARNRSEILDVWGLSRITSMGRGITALFSGPSGTGKTMAAQVLAGSLGLDCLRIDLAGVVSKYIGETEKHLRQVFEACERAPSLLFFDEADALFGKRTSVNDAHDRFANIEIDYVLQAMERFDGVAVLATNRKGDIDPALVRRLRFIVDFAPPGPAERELLWRRCLDGAVDATGLPIASNIDYPGLARELDLTGAGIKSAVLASAFLARADGSRIEMRHVMGAARRELEKHGHVVRAGQLVWR